MILIIGTMSRARIGQGTAPSRHYHTPRRLVVRCHGRDMPPIWKPPPDTVSQRRSGWAVSLIHTWLWISLCMSA